MGMWCEKNVISAGLRLVKLSVPVLYDCDLMMLIEIQQQLNGFRDQRRMQIKVNIRHTDMHFSNAEAAL